MDATGTGWLIGDSNLTTILPPMATSPAVEFQVSNWTQYTQLEAVVDDPSLARIPGQTGVAKECDESDNTVVVR